MNDFEAATMTPVMFLRAAEISTVMRPSPTGSHVPDMMGMVVVTSFSAITDEH